MTFGKRPHFVTGNFLETTLNTLPNMLLQHGSLHYQTLQVKETIADSATKTKVAILEVMPYHLGCILFVKNMCRLAHIQGVGKTINTRVAGNVWCHFRVNIPWTQTQFSLELKPRCSPFLWSRLGMFPSTLRVSLVPSSAMWRQSCSHGKKRGHAYLC